ncbi:MAG: hypothetical protein M3033_14075 [Acidobacteriota bacterium]|nr:hypothetical protein [Acidobacteriota bacterium]
MGKIKNYIGLKPNVASKNKGEKGSTYIEVIVSIVILTVGLLAMLSALTYALLYEQEAEKKTRAKEIASSMVESIFAIRDIQAKDNLSISGWDAIQIKATGNTGIFIDGWFPVREDPGADGIYGTTDDSCAATGNCTTSPIVDGYERSIAITDVVENGIARKRRIDVSVRYKTVGGIYRQETLSTIIANLPMN